MTMVICRLSHSPFIQRIYLMKWQKMSGKDVVNIEIFKTLIFFAFGLCVRFNVNREETMKPTHNPEDRDS